MILKGELMMSGLTEKSKAAFALMGKSDKYYVIYEPREPIDLEPYCLYGEKSEGDEYASSILRLSFDEVRWIMSERIAMLGGNPEV
jgi:hypothetical protein